MYMCICVCEYFPQWNSSGLPPLFEQKLTLPAFVVFETEQHSVAQVLTSGTQRAVYMLSHTYERVIFVLVCVFVCSVSTGQGSLALPYLDSRWGRGGWGHMGVQRNPSDRNKNSEVRHDVCLGELSTPGRQDNVKKQTAENKGRVTTVGRR